MKPIWISEADVVQVMDFGEAIAAMESGLMLEARGEVQNMVKTHVSWNSGNNLHAIGGVVASAGIVGTKTWAHTSNGTCPLLVLFDAENGSLKAVIEAFALGQMRTGAVSGVATRWLAQAEADELAIIGTGKQSLPQVAAVAAVRPLKRVRVFSPSQAGRTALMSKLREEFEFEIVEARSVEAAVDGAAVVTLVTRATSPVLSAGMLRPGAHVNAVGAITPEREEFGQDLFPRCGIVAVDSLRAAKMLSKEFITRFGDESGDWANVKPLARIVATGEGRDKDTDLSLFKAMGMGLSDMALAGEIYRRAVSGGFGREMPQPQKVRPRFGRRQVTQAA